MSTLSRLWRLEWRLCQRDGSAWAVAVLLAAAMTYAIGNGLQWRTFTERALATAQTENERQFAELRARAGALHASGRRLGTFDVPVSPGFVSLFTPRYAALPPQPLAFLSVGQSDVLPYYFRVTGERRDSFLDAEEIDNPTNLLQGRVDVAFVLTMVVPLLLLAISAGAVASDRESGVLALVASQPAPLRVLVGLRLGIRGGWSLLWLSASILCALIAGAVAVSSARTAMSIGLLAVALVGWVALWQAIGGLASAWVRSSGTSALLGLTVWVGTAVLTPAVLHLVAGAIHPVPPRTALIERTRALDSEIRTQIVRLLDDYYRAHPDARPAGLDTPATTSRSTGPLSSRKSSGRVRRSSRPTSRRSRSSSSSSRAGRGLRQAWRFRSCSTRSPAPARIAICGSSTRSVAFTPLIGRSSSHARIASPG